VALEGKCWINSHWHIENKSTVCAQFSNSVVIIDWDVIYTCGECCRLLLGCLSIRSSWMTLLEHFSRFFRTAILHLLVKITPKYVNTVGIYLLESLVPPYFFRQW